MKRTYATIVLDSSGSMDISKETTRTTFNEQIQQLKEDANPEHEILVSIVTFNARIKEHHWNIPAQNLVEIGEKDYRPNGGTALNDAVGYTLKKMQETSEDGEDTAYLVIIISDGAERDSTKFSKSHVNAMVEELEANGRWTITFMGCNKYYVENIAREYGLKMSNVAVWDNSNLKTATKGMSAVGVGTRNYMRSRKEAPITVQCCNHFYSQTDDLLDTTNDESVVLSSDSFRAAADIEAETPITVGATTVGPDGRLSNSQLTKK